MTDKFGEESSELDADRGSVQQRRLRSAVERANEYQADPGRTTADRGESSQEPVRPMEEWHDLVSQRIEDAMRQGLFDNLSGQGKPLNLDRNPFVPDDQQMAVDLLRNNGLTPDWISERSAILSAIDAMRAELRLAKSQAETAISTAEDEERSSEARQRWERWLQGWCERVDKLNDRILVHNLKQPVAHLEIVQLRLTNELGRAQVELSSTDRRPTAGS